MKNIYDFFSLYRLYRRHHSRGYALNRAYRIAFTKEPF